MFTPAPGQGPGDSRLHEDRFIDGSHHGLDSPGSLLERLRDVYAPAIFDNYTPQGTSRGYRKISDPPDSKRVFFPMGYGAACGSVSGGAPRLVLEIDECVGIILEKSKLSGRQAEVHLHEKRVSLETGEAIPTSFQLDAAALCTDYEPLASWMPRPMWQTTISSEPLKSTIGRDLRTAEADRAWYSATAEKSARMRSEAAQPMTHLAAAIAEGVSVALAKMQAKPEKKV